MSYLKLNHAPAASQQNWGAMLLLILGGVLCCIVIMYTQSLTREIELLNKERQHISQPQKPLNKRLINAEQDTKRQQDVREIKTAIGEIVMPWISIFKALETANHEGVKMLAVEPSAKSKKVRLTAVAFDIDNMMTYMRSLGEQNALKQVRLLSHEVVDVNGQNAIEFVVEAIWKN